MTVRYRSPRLLEPGDDLSDFDCRSEQQTRWLRRHARQAHAAGTSKVLVVTPAETDDARGFYLHLVPEFEPSPTDPLHLVLLMKDILRQL